jgi:hypothetical protein
MKPASRHLDKAQRAALGIVGLALATLLADVLGHPPGEATHGTVEAAIYALGAIAAGMGTISASRDVARAWRGPVTTPGQSGPPTE